MNNFEKIKQINIDEMAEFLRKFSNCSFCNLYLKPKTCSNCKQNYERPFKNWLKSECESEVENAR